MEVNVITPYRPKIETPDPRVFDKNEDGVVNAQDVKLIIPEVKNSEDKKLDLYA
jgi:hypothetical protein